MEEESKQWILWNWKINKNDTTVGSVDANKNNNDRMIIDPTLVIFLDHVSLKKNLLKILLKLLLIFS